MGQIDIKHVHFAVFSYHISLIVDDRVRQVVTFPFQVALRKAPKRQPDLVVEGQLAVTIVEMLV